MSCDLFAAVQGLLEADSTAAVKEFVSLHPELLDDAAIEVLGRFAEETDDRHRPIVDSLLAVVMECRAVGIEAAFQNFALAGPGRDLTEGLASLIVADDAAEMRAVVAQSPELLGDAAERRLREMEADSSDYSADRINAIIEFLRACRHGNTEAACAAYDHDKAEVDAANRLAAEYIFMKDAAAEADFLQTHPILLGRQADRAVVKFLEMLPPDPSPGVVALLDRARAKLETVRSLRGSHRAGG